MKATMRGILFLLALFCSETMAAPSFLHIEAIEGEVGHKGYEDWIDIWALHFAIDRVDGANRTPVFSDLTIVKKIDKSSPLLFREATAGGEIPVVLIDFFRNSASEPRYLRVRLSNVFISAYSLQHREPDSLEFVSLNFGRIELEQTKPDNSATTRVYYDVVAQEGGPLPDGPSPSTNTAPTISSIPDQTVAVNSSVVVNFTIDDLETPASYLTLTRASSDPALVPLSNITFGGTEKNRTATITPAANTFGSSTITIGVSDGTLSAASQFTVTVGQQEGPFISEIADVAIGEGDSTTVSFTIGHPTADLDSLMVTGASSNQELLPAGNIILAGSGAARTAELTPRPGAIGQAEVTITVNDGTLSSESAFILTVEAVTPPPAISAPDLVKGVGGAPVPIGGIAISDPAAGSEPIRLTMTTPQARLEVSTEVPGGLIAENIQGNGTSAIAIFAPLDAINTTFAADDGFLFTGALSGSEAISLEASRSGSSFLSIEVLLYDSSVTLWLSDFFSQEELNDPEKEATLWGKLANPAHDGVVNLLKYALGLSPLESHAGPDLPGAYLVEEGAAQYLAFTIMRRTDDPVLEYSPQVSSDLQIWESGPGVFEEAAVAPAGDDFEQVVYRHRLSEEGPKRRFVRLQVTHGVN